MKGDYSTMKLSDKSYDELSKIVNESYKKTQDIRKTMKETGLSFDLVWEMTGMKDTLDFRKTGEDWMIETPRVT